jgi:drug/metabolite transporter (DMT)-like permease
VNHRNASALLPYSILILGILFLSVSPLFVRWANAPGVVTSFYRMLTVTTIIGLVYSFRQKTEDTERNPGVIWLLPVLGGVFSAIDHALWSTSIENTFVANATLLNYIAPLWVSLVAIYIMHESYSGIFWIGLVMVLSGAWIVTGVRFGDFTNISIAGEGFAALSSFFYAGYFIVSQRALKHYKILDYLLISSGVAMVILLIIILISGFSIFGYSKETFLLFLIAGLFSQLGGYFSINFALSHIPAPIVSSLLILQPVMTALLAVRFQAEMISSLQILGGLCVLGGVYIVKISKNAQIK